MSSSTSSSRPFFARVVLAGLLSMAASLGLVRGFTWFKDLSGETILGRVAEARDALPQIAAEPKPLVLFYGSSMVEAGFSPRHFDRELAARGAEVKSFNFGFGGLNPYFQDYFARRICDQMRPTNRRFALTLIEFNPFQTTSARWQAAKPIIDSMVAGLASPRELWQITREDPTRGARLATIRYLRDGLSAELVTSFYSIPFQEPYADSPTPEDPATAKRREEVEKILAERFEQDYPNHIHREWSYEWQGAGTIPEERSADTVALVREFAELSRSKHRMEEDLLARIHAADAVELRFEEELVQGFLRMVAALRECSDQMEIVLTPRNTEWIQYSPETAARLEAQLERLEDEAGVVVRNFQVTDRITPAMFRDTTHLALYLGDVAFTDLLVDEYGERLGAPSRTELPPN